jgi:hypothetical protein
VALSVEDRLAVHELVSLHGRLMDSGEFGRMDELFCAGVVYDVSGFGRGELRGYEAISEASLAVGDANRSVITSRTSA